MTTENNQSQPESKFSLPASEVGRNVVIWALIAGIGGGLVGSWLMLRYSKVGSLAGFTKSQVVVAEQSAVIDVAKKASPSVVSITSSQVTTNFFGIGQTQQGAGTGIIVTSDGLIVTNKHVVPAGTSEVTVVTSDGKEYKGAKVLARDPLNDVAFVKVAATGLKAAEIGDSSAMVVGQQVVAIGNALGQFQNTVTTGVISGLSRPITASDGTSGGESLSGLLQTDAAINPGNSGHRHYYRCSWSGAEHWLRNTYKRRQVTHSKRSVKR
jgi:S1-C subfamily serine protease